jgi:hypothetical protein
MCLEIDSFITDVTDFLPTIFTLLISFIANTALLFGLREYGLILGDS